MEKTTGIKIFASNKKAHFNYFLSDFLECGIELTGTEIKSIRNHGCSINDAFVVIKHNECYIMNMNIAPYIMGNIYNHDPLRNRRLLLHKDEILKLAQRVQKDGYTLVPTKVYLKKGRCKIEIALGKGKKLYDKRETIKERDVTKHIEKALKRD